MTRELLMNTGFVWVDSVDPGLSENGVSFLNFWFNTVSGDVFLCLDDTVGSQAWEKIAVDGGSLTDLAINKVEIQVGGPTITSGSGAPSASEPQGSLYLRTDGSGTNDRAYIATDSSGTWTAIVTVA